VTGSVQAGNFGKTTAVSYVIKSLPFCDRFVIIALHIKTNSRTKQPKHTLNKEDYDAKISCHVYNFIDS
jgi:hypothetical protein